MAADEQLYLNSSLVISMYGNLPGNDVGNNDQFVMTNKQAKNFSQGLSRVRKQTEKQLTNPFQVTSSVEVTTVGQQGIIRISVPGLMQVNFNVEPKQEMFEGDGEVISQMEAKEIGTNISAAFLGSLFKQNSTTNMPAQ